MGKISSKNKNSEKVEKKIEKKEKVIFLGSVGVGKTCIISQLAFKIFDPNTNATSSHSLCTKEITFPDKSALTLEIWDITGQEH